jgi:thiamine biosynthesis protein ThiI
VLFRSTVALARRIGTFEKSSEPQEDCCSLFVPDHPETRGSPTVLDGIEAGLPIAEWVERMVAGAEAEDLDSEGRRVTRGA